MYVNHEQVRSYVEMAKMSKTCFFWMVLCCLHAVAVMEQEHLSHGAHHPVHGEHYDGGDHNVEFDHQAVLGSEKANEEFQELAPHEAKKRLATLVDKMDTNGDGFISLAELEQWITKSFVTLNREEALSKMQNEDLNNDTIVTWPEYLKAVYGYEPSDLVDMENDENKELVLFIRMVHEDKNRFARADLDGDQQLDVDEYAAFIHPFDYPHMQEYELDRTLEDYDRNYDNYISFKEYQGDSPGHKEIQIIDRENFDEYDTNKDGRLSREEIRAWILPNFKGSVTDEAEHLLSQTDLDKDGKLSKQEILDMHLLWVGSSATDYGQALHQHDPQEL